MRIGLVLNILDEEYQISLYRGIKRRAAELGIQIICFQEGNTEFRSDAFIGRLPQKDFFNLDGIILLTSVVIDSCTLNNKTDIQNIWGELPLVSVGQKIDGVPSLLIQTDDSMRDLVDHLVLTHKYRNFIYIGGSGKVRLDDLDAAACGMVFEPCAIRHVDEESPCVLERRGLSERRHNLSEKPHELAVEIGRVVDDAQMRMSRPRGERPGVELDRFLERFDARGVVVGRVERLRALCRGHHMKHGVILVA